MCSSLTCEEGLVIETENEMYLLIVLLKFVKVEETNVLQLDM